MLKLTQCLRKKKKIPNKVMSLTSSDSPNICRLSEWPRITQSQPISLIMTALKIKPEDQWSCKRSPESAAYTNKRLNIMAEWILGFCKDGPTPPSHSQKGANVESSRAPYQSAFSQEDLHEWSPLVFNQQQLITVTDFTNHQEAK